MTNKMTPDEVLDKSDKFEGRFFSTSQYTPGKSDRIDIDPAEIVEALREAIAQRDGWKKRWNTDRQAKLATEDRLLAIINNLAAERDELRREADTRLKWKPKT